jgi:hypothetical protein
MKKTILLITGIWLGTIFVSQHLLSNSTMLPGEDPLGIAQAVSEIAVFPNPSDGRFQMTFEYRGSEKISAKVFDLTGKLLQNISEELVVGETTVTADVDLESPSAGFYFIRIEWGKKLLTKKIIIR